MQNELTYFHDCMIVEVKVGEARTVIRSVSTPAGDFELDLRQQDATVLSANFDHEEKVVLTFTPHLPHTQKAGKPGWTQLALKPGRYFVMGRLAIDDKLIAYPGISAFGWPDNSVKPAVSRAIFDSGDSHEFAVFNVVPTSQTDLFNSKGHMAKDVLSNLVAASLKSDEAGFSATMNLLLRVDHIRQKMWTKSAFEAGNLLTNWKGAAKKNDKAYALWIAYRMGKFDVDERLFKALSAASKEDPDKWDSANIATELRLTNSVTYPNQKQLSHLLSISRQITVLETFSEAGTEPVRAFLANNIYPTYSESMNKSLILALRSVEAKTGSSKRLLERLAEWLDEPNRDPSVSTQSQEALIAYWLSRFEDLSESSLTQGLDELIAP